MLLLESKEQDEEKEKINKWQMEIISQEKRIKSQKKNS